MAHYIRSTYGNRIRYIADVAGGQGLLSRILCKKYNYASEVIDPRGWCLRGIENRQELYTADMSGYYDLVVGLHPDEATRPVAESALTRPVILVPCCNFWSEEKLGAKELLAAIEEYYTQHAVNYARVVLDFKGPKNIALVSEPPLARRFATNLEEEMNDGEYRHAAS